MTQDLFRAAVSIPLALCIAAAAVASGCGPKVVVVNYLGTPALAPGTRPEMNTPGFWVDRCPDADAVIMTEDDIAAFNAETRLRTRAVTDVAGLSPRRNGSSVKDSLARMASSIALRNYVDASGTSAAKMIADLESYMSLDAISKTVEVTWALVTRSCDQRLLPTAEPLFKNVTDTAIDRLQNNTLDPGTAVAVLHRTRDGVWSYVIGPYSEGWVKTEFLAECPRDVIQRYLAWEPFVVVISAKADLFADPLQRVHLQSVQMGTRLPLLGPAGEDAVEVLLPVRTDGGACVFDAACVAASQVHRGYLAYTPRNAIVQAFRLLHSPYGWGGMYSEQDCSRLIQEVFATFGIVMPRNSSQQAKTGTPIASFKGAAESARVRALAAHAIPGATIIHFPGHIMLYIGMANGMPYVIHDLYAYTETTAGQEQLVAIGRVAVTSLALGGSSPKGSFLMRAENVRLIARTNPTGQQMPEGK